MVIFAESRIPEPMEADRGEGGASWSLQTLSDRICLLCPVKVRPQVRLRRTGDVIDAEQLGHGMIPHPALQRVAAVHRTGGRLHAGLFVAEARQAPVVY
jgi:hypothetical protein